MPWKHTGLAVLGGHLERRAYDKVVQGLIRQPQRFVCTFPETFVGVAQGRDFRGRVGNGGHVQPSAIADNRLEASHVWVFRAVHQALAQSHGEVKEARNSFPSENFHEDILEGR
jgi:hypothetical protein